MSPGKVWRSTQPLDDTEVQLHSEQRSFLSHIYFAIVSPCGDHPLAVPISLAKACPFGPASGKLSGKLDR